MNATAKGRLILVFQPRAKKLDSMAKGPEEERDVGPKSPLLELAQHRAAVTGEGDRRAERNKRPG